MYGGGSNYKLSPRSLSASRPITIGGGFQDDVNNNNNNNNLPIPPTSNNNNNNSRSGLDALLVNNQPQSNETQEGSASGQQPGVQFQTTQTKNKPIMITQSLNARGSHLTSSAQSLPPPRAPFLGARNPMDNHRLRSMPSIELPEATPLNTPSGVSISSSLLNGHHFPMAQRTSSGGSFVGLGNFHDKMGVNLLGQETSPNRGPAGGGGGGLDGYSPHQQNQGSYHPSNNQQNLQYQQYHNQNNPSSSYHESLTQGGELFPHSLPTYMDRASVDQLWAEKRRQVQHLRRGSSGTIQTNATTNPTNNNNNVNNNADNIRAVSVGGPNNFSKKEGTLGDLMASANKLNELDNNETDSSDDDRRNETISPQQQQFQQFNNIHGTQNTSPYQQHYSLLF